MYDSIPNLLPIQNLGLTDRIIRGMIAVLLIGLPTLDLANGAVFDWHGYAILLGTYPALTSILGWDPFYALFNVRSCGYEPRNQCGTFPYEVDAALGHNPTVDKDHEFDHSLSTAHRYGTWKNALNTKTQNRLLILSTVILALAVFVYTYWGGE